MTPRKASLRVAHARSCPNAGKTALDSLKGCKCQPSYYTFQRGTDEEPRLVDRNPVPSFRKRLELDIPEGSELYENAEVARMWTAMRQLKFEPVYVYVCKALLTTGTRIGELVGADLADVDLLAGTF